MKIWEIQFLRGELYFFKKKKISSPGGEPAMVLQYCNYNGSLSINIGARFMKSFGHAVYEKNIVAVQFPILSTSALFVSVLLPLTHTCVHKVWPPSELIAIIYHWTQIIATDLSIQQWAKTCRPFSGQNILTTLEPRASQFSTAFLLSLF
jgi:hypothetical protein